MLTKIGLTRILAQCLRHQSRCCLSSSVVLSQKSDDPVQQLFVEKIREYAQKKKSAGGKLVDATPETMKDFQFEIDRLQNQYKATGQDMTKFPDFKFSDRELETAPTQEDRDPKDLPL